MCSAVLALCWTGIGLADEEGAFVEGTASVGGHYSDFSDNPNRVGEYVNLNATKDLQADMYLDLFGGTGNTLYNILSLNPNPIALPRGHNRSSSTAYPTFTRSTTRSTAAHNLRPRA